MTNPEIVWFDIVVSVCTRKLDIYSKAYWSVWTIEWCHYVDMDRCIQSYDRILIIKSL